VRSAELKAYANQLGRLVWRFSFAVNRTLVLYREPVLDMQLVQERIANAAMDLFAATCVVSRWDSELQARSRNGSEESEHAAADLFVRRAFRDIRRNLRGLGDNDDRALLATADIVLKSKPPAPGAP
jgi:alkylation response protein AidB-like acyl-CoA dehydrogenase